MKVRLWRERENARQANTLPIFFQHKNSFLATALKGRQIKQKYFLNNYFGRVRTEKMKKLRFTGRRRDVS